MAVYIITYDLNAPGQDYKALYSAIKEYSTHWNFVDSNWIVETSDSALQVHDKLKPHFGANDQLFVAKLGGEAAWSGFKADGTTWLQARLGKK